MTPWGRGVFFQNASFLAFVSPSFCVQSLSFVILRRLPFARRPISPPSSLVVPHSFSIPSIVRNLGKFSNPIPLLVIFDRRFLVTPSESRPQTRCNRRARPKEKFRLHSRPSAPDPLRSLLSAAMTLIETIRSMPLDLISVARTTTTHNDIKVRPEYVRSTFEICVLLY